MSAPPHRGSLLQNLDLDKQQLLDLLTLAAQLKRDKQHGEEIPRLRGKSISLVFEQNSTRTRCYFEVAAHDQGGQATYLGQLGSAESIADTARVLGRLYDGIALRGHAQDTVDQFAEHSGVPVWNALTDRWHPTQSFADILTMTEHHGGEVEDIALCFTGDGHSSVARSLLVTGALLGMDVRIASPPELQPPPDVVAEAERLARSSGACLLVTDDLHVAVHGADFVYTDEWASAPSLLPYRVTDDVLDSGNRPGVRFMHRLPDRSENRMHTIKALLVRALAA